MKKDFIISKETRLLSVQSIYSLYSANEIGAKLDVGAALSGAIYLSCQSDSDIEEDRNKSPESIIAERYAKLTEVYRSTYCSKDKIVLDKLKLAIEREEGQINDEYKAEYGELLSSLRSFIMQSWLNKDNALRYIESKLKNGWALRRLPKVVVAILILGVFEVREAEKEKVGEIIRCYIEVAKRMGHKSEKGFINALLDMVKESIA